MIRLGITGVVVAAFVFGVIVVRRELRDYEYELQQGRW